MTLSGRIIHSVSGFYYVEAADAVFECRARGSLRNKKISPLVGDFAAIETDGKQGVITEIAKRKNQLQRPPLANIDVLFIVSSLVQPSPDFYLIDKLSVFAVKKGIEPVIIFSKCDLCSAVPYLSVYSRSGLKTIACSAVNDSGIDEISKCIHGRTCAFTGNSGVGKSSLINALSPGLMLKTDEISLKLGRGRHTTRDVSLYPSAGGFVVDTPGFSLMDFNLTGERIYKDELPSCFPEFAPFTKKCRFMSSCAHISDSGCAVVNAVEKGLISRERYDSYVKMYTEVKDLKKWE